MTMWGLSAPTASDMWVALLCEIDERRVEVIRLGTAEDACAVFQTLKETLCTRERERERRTEGG